ncbi:hypothetical protein AX16_004322 [Volvariella volvacea WC 439]|nr:hypothetical protein AX16_004322 [Volvariella volvacea WC 439]
MVSVLLSPEILSRVFHFCFAGPVALPPKRYDMPWVLMHVCSFWRAIILGNPRIWANLSIDLTRTTKTRSLMDVVQQTISRSASQLLSLKIVTTLNDDNDPSPVPFIDAFVIPNTKRIRALNLTAEVDHLENLLALPPDSFEQLRSLDLTTTHYLPESDPLWTAPSFTFRYARRLSRVTVTSRYDLLDFQMLKIPWAGLTELHCVTTFVPPVGCHVMLRSCRNLVHCTLGIARLDEDSIPTLTTIIPTILPSLQSFNVEFAPSKHYHHFFRPLVFSNLKHLGVTCDKSLPWNIQAFQALHSKSAFSLRTLKLGFRTEPRDLESILQSHPTLVELDATNTGPVADSILDGIATGRLLPSLTTISCLTPALGRFIDMLEARNPQAPILIAPGTNKTSGPGASNIRSATVVSDGREEEHKFRLNALARMGVNVQIIPYATEGRRE